MSPAFHKDVCRVKVRGNLSSCKNRTLESIVCDNGTKRPVKLRKLSNLWSDDWT